MNKLLLLLLFTIFCLSSAQAQKENYNWYFGNFAAITFNTKDVSPVALLNNRMNTQGGCSTISDKYGNLLFYTNVDTVYNRNHKIMKNGIGISVGEDMGNVIIIPFQDNNRFFYIFTTSFPCLYGYYNTDSICFKEFRYSIVDISEDKGLGAVVVKNELIYQNTTEKLTAIKHSNNRDLWILIHEWDSNNFLAYLFNNNGLQTTPVISSSGIAHLKVKFPLYEDYESGYGYMKASEDSKKLAVAVCGSDLVQIFDFDNSTGKVSNPITIADSSSSDFGDTYGVEFSPNGSKLYVTTGHEDCYGVLIQLDLSSNNVDTMIKNRTLIAESSGFFGALQLGPDNKIYCSHYGNWYLPVINKPDSLGVKCDYLEKGVNLGDDFKHRGAYGLPQKILYAPEFKSLTLKTISTICQGDSISLDVDGIVIDSTSCFNWTGPNGFISNLKNPKIYSTDTSNSGWYHLTYISINTYLQDSIFVDVIAKPDAKIIILGSSVLCAGDSVVLRANNSDSLNDFYEWSNGARTNSIVVFNAGIYKLKVTNKTGCSDSSEINIRIKPFPKVSIFVDGNTNLCRGDSAILTAFPKYTGNYSYKWNNGDTSRQIIAKSTFRYKVVMTDDCKNSDSAEVEISKVNLVATINQTNKLCHNQITLLTAQPSGQGYSYKWSTGETTQSISVDKAGKYSIIVTLNNFCSDTSQVMIEEYPVPSVSIIGDSLICPGSTGSLAVQQDFVSYKWSTGEIIKDILINKAGIYSVTVTDTNGCTGTANFEVKEFVFNLSGLIDMDFGKIPKGSSISKTITLKNESNAEINISRVITKANSPEYQIQTNPTLPAKLKLNEAIEISVSFSPSEFKEYPDSIVVETDFPCQNKISSLLFGKTGAKTLVYLPDTLGAVGTKDYCIPLFASLSEISTETLSYTSIVRFDATLFQPDIIYSSYILDNERFVELSGNNIQISHQKTTIGEFCGIILLAEKDRTVLKIDNFSWTTPGIETETKHGSLTLTGVCARNLSRLKLIESEEITLAPNPAEDFLEINAGNSHTCSLQEYFYIYNVFGKNVLKICLNSQYPLPDTPLKIDVSGLVSGIYFLRIGDKTRKFIKI